MSGSLNMCKPLLLVSAAFSACVRPVLCLRSCTKISCFYVRTCSLSSQLFVVSSLKAQTEVLTARLLLWLTNAAQTAVWPRCVAGFCGCFHRKCQLTSFLLFLFRSSRISESFSILVECSNGTILLYKTLWKWEHFAQLQLSKILFLM